MIETYRKLMEERTAGEADDSGFTLIELLIVIVVLGILAAIVVFALSGVTSNSLVAACQSDSKTVDLAVANLQAENPGSTYATAPAWQSALTTTSASVVGSPFLQTWPTGSQGSTQYYSISINPTAGTVLTGYADDGATTPPTATANAGDVIVTINPGSTVAPAKTNYNGTYDATTNPSTACSGA
jgi:prepilin-type N-terminal cleavage/methylation domain-containing protein